jgi:RNA 2',3'-cyclic 3'-phosphodiesterase
MAEQLCLPGFENNSRLDNLFFACLPPADRAARIAHIARHLDQEHGLRGSLISPRRLHISLHGLGLYVGLPRALVVAAREAAATVSMARFEVVFDCVMSFKGRDRPFVLCAGDGATALTAFHRALGDAMTKAGLGRRVTTHFTPHITLLYGDRLVKQQSIEQVRWTVQDFVLVHSLVGRRQHIHLDHWPLRG